MQDCRNRYFAGSQIIVDGVRKAFQQCLPDSTVDDLEPIWKLSNLAERCECYLFEAGSQARICSMVPLNG